MSITQFVLLKIKELRSSVHCALLHHLLCRPQLPPCAATATYLPVPRDRSSQCSYSWSCCEAFHTGGSLSGKPTQSSLLIVTYFRFCFEQCLVQLLRRNKLYISWPFSLLQKDLGLWKIQQNNCGWPRMDPTNPPSKVDLHVY